MLIWDDLRLGESGLSFIGQCNNVPITHLKGEQIWIHEPNERFL